PSVACRAAASAAAGVDDHLRGDDAAAAAQDAAGQAAGLAHLVRAAHHRAAGGQRSDAGRQPGAVTVAGRAARAAEPGRGGSVEATSNLRSMAGCKEALAFK